MVLRAFHQQEHTSPWHTRAGTFLTNLFTMGLCSGRVPCLMQARVFLPPAVPRAWPAKARAHCRAERGKTSEERYAGVHDTQARKQYSSQTPCRLFKSSHVLSSRHCHFRVQARQIESELEAKTSAFAKLCSGYDGAYTGRGESGLAAEQARAPSVISSRASHTCTMPPLCRDNCMTFLDKPA